MAPGQHGCYGLQSSHGYSRACLHLGFSSFFTLLGSGEVRREGGGRREEEMASLPVHSICRGTQIPVPTNVCGPPLVELPIMPVTALVGAGSKSALMACS